MENKKKFVSWKLNLSWKQKIAVLFLILYSALLGYIYGLLVGGFGT